MSETNKNSRNIKTIISNIFTEYNKQPAHFKVLDLFIIIFLVEFIVYLFYAILTNFELQTKESSIILLPLILAGLFTAYRFKYSVEAQEDTNKNTTNLGQDLKALATISMVFALAVFMIAFFYPF